MPLLVRRHGINRKTYLSLLPNPRVSYCKHNLLTHSSQIGFYYLALAMVTTIFCICSLRTNVVFFSALFTLIFAFGSAAGAFWNIALGNADLGKRLTIVSLPTFNTLTESSYFQYINGEPWGKADKPHPY